jgi:L-asparagine transporter-like permease
MKRIIISAGVALAVLIALGGITLSAQQKAKVVNVNKHKGFVYIDQGIDAGFVMGAAVCIYSHSGKQIACGRVRETKKSGHAMVRVEKEKSHHIEDGMTAKLKVKKK